jgi:hypothetical protein
MAARREVPDTKQSADREAEAGARTGLDEVKRTFGERGPCGCDDGSANLNRHMAKCGPETGVAEARMAPPRARWLDKLQEQPWLPLPE